MLRREAFFQGIERARADITEYDANGGEGEHCGGTVVVKCIRIYLDRLHQGCLGKLGITDRHWGFRDAEITY